MMKIHASALRAPSNEPAAGSHAADDPFTSANPPGGFASMLRQAAPAPTAPVPAAQPAAAPSRQTASAPTAARHGEAASKPAQDSTAKTQTETETETQTETETEAAATPEAAPANHARASLAARLRAAAAPRCPQVVPEAADTVEAESSAPAGTSASTSPRDITDPVPQPLPAASAAPIDPNILQWLAGQQRAAAPLLPAGDANGTGPTRDARAVSRSADAPTPSTDTTPTVGADATDTRAQRAPELRADADATPAPGRMAHRAATDPGRFAAALGELHAAEKPQPAPATTTSAVAGPSAAALAALMAPARPAAFEAAAPAAVAIATPVSAPEFAQALGLQMSLLMREGIQHAELHLNPAEMGPVSVQIVMDGTQARVDFGADLAATRQAIEAGLPELAGALRDAGFTLAGGGVSQHAGSRNGADANGSGEGGRRQRSTVSVSQDAVGRVSAAAQRIVSAGGIDVFA